MTLLMSYPPRGIASYLLVFVIALALGAAGAWSLRRRAPLDPVTTHGEWIYVKKGADSIRAYVAYPERKTKAPAVVVIHEIYGLTDWEPTVADRLAREGYVAILPDLLSSKHGKSPADADSAASSSAISSRTASHPTSTRCMPT